MCIICCHIRACHSLFSNQRNCHFVLAVVTLLLVNDYSHLAVSNEVAVSYQISFSVKWQYQGKWPTRSPPTFVDRACLENAPLATYTYRSFDYQINGK